MLEGKKFKFSVGGGNFSSIPMGVYTCQIVDVNAVTKMNKFKGEEQEMLSYKFAILDDIALDDGGTTRNRYLWKDCSISMNEKSWMYKLAKAVVGREMTTEEMENFDAESIIGKQVVVMLEEKPNKENTAVFNNIMSFSKAVKQLTPVEYTAPPATIVKGSTGLNVPKTAPTTVAEEITDLEQELNK